MDHTNSETSKQPYGEFREEVHMHDFDTGKPTEICSICGITVARWKYDTNQI